MIPNADVNTVLIQNPNLSVDIDRVHIIEYADMHLVLDEYRAVRQYVEKYPNDQVENHRAFLLC
jgi:hypothetical protein